MATIMATECPIWPTLFLCVCVSVIIKHVSKHVLCIVSVEAAAGIIMNPRKRRIRKGSDTKIGKKAVAHGILIG